LAEDRRRALWEVLRIEEAPAGPLAPHPPADTTPASLPPITAAESTAQDYATHGASAKHHPMEFFRDRLRASGLPTLGELAGREPGPVQVAGVVNSRQRPGTAKGFVFVSLEDETGMVNVIIAPSLFERTREIVMNRPMLRVEGDLERRHDVVNIKARSLASL
jgi:error-prone DNA polymerase